MGMEYARLYFEFLDGEKAQFLFDECGDHGLVCLMRLWVRAGQRNNDGVFEKSGRALEKIAKWKGKSGKLVDTLLDSDFPLLDKLGENEFYLHNYIKNNPHLCEKAKQIRTEKARRAGLASAKKSKEASTTSQLQVNSGSTASQLNSTQGQLGSTKVTKGNITKGKVIKEKHCRVAKEKKLELENLIDEIINLWKEISGQSKMSVKTKTYRTQVRGRIDGLGSERRIKEHDDVIESFRYVFTNKGKQANDDEYRRFSVHDWNLTTLTRPSHFNTYLDEPKHGTARSSSSPADKDAKKKRDWIDSLPPFIDTEKEYLNREQFAEIYFKTPKEKRAPLNAMIKRQREKEKDRGGNAVRAKDIVNGIIGGK